MRIKIIEWCLYTIKIIHTYIKNIHWNPSEVLEEDEKFTTKYNRKAECSKMTELVWEHALISQ